MNKNIFYKIACFLLVSIMTWFGINYIKSIYNNKNEVLLVAEPTKFVIHQDDSIGSYQSVFTTLINKATKAVKIGRIETSCECTTIDNLTGVSIPPKGRHRLNMTIRLPRYGSSNVVVKLFIKDQKSPLVLSLLAQSSNLLPVISKKINENPVFFNLAAPGELQIASLFTLEAEQSKNWFSEFYCSIPQLDISVKSVTVTNDTPYDASNDVIAEPFQKRYDLQLKWKDLPIRQDFSGEYYGIERLTNKRILLGRINGNLNKI